MTMNNQPSRNILRTVDCVINGSDFKTFTIIGRTEEVSPTWVDPRTQNDEIKVITTDVDPLNGVISKDSDLGSKLLTARIGDSLIVNGTTYQVASKERHMNHPSVATRQTGYEIKGNINAAGEKIYHMPGQYFYDRVVVNSAFGGRWFKTEEQAQGAGFRRSKV